MIKISMPDGKFVIIAAYTEAAKFSKPPFSQSSTELQPWIGMNFNAAGECVGGKTLLESEKKFIIQKAAEKNFKIEEVAHA